MEKLTEAQFLCLCWYRDHEHTFPRAIIPADTKWNMRQVNRLLYMGMLRVGLGGWHIPSDLGRSAIASHTERRP